MLKSSNNDAITHRLYVDELQRVHTEDGIAGSGTGFHLARIFPLSQSCNSDKTHVSIIDSLTLCQSILRLLPASRTNTNDRLSLW